MVKRIKRYIIIGILLAAGYFFAAYHIIIYDKKEFEILKKSYLTFEYTFYNATNKKPEVIMKIDLLREAGIGDLLVDIGMLSQTQKEALDDRFYSEDY